MLSAYRAYNAVMKALAQAVPDKVIAGGFEIRGEVAYFESQIVPAPAVLPMLTVGGLMWNRRRREG